MSLGMMSIKNDLCFIEGEYYPAGGTYKPMRYAHGDVCEQCWLKPERSEPWYCWPSFDLSIRAVGSAGCLHGGER